MLRLRLRKVPAEHEIGFLKKKLGSTQLRERTLLSRGEKGSSLASCYVLLLLSTLNEPAL